MADIEYDFAADVSAADRAIAKLESKIEKLERQLKSNARTSRKGANSAQSDFQMMVSGAASVAGGIGVISVVTRSAQLAVGALRAEYQDLVETQKASAAAQRTFSQAFDSALLNLGLGPEATPQNLQRMIDRIGDATRAQPVQIANVLSTALSARGNLTIADVEEAATASLSLTKNVPEAQAPLTGAVLDLQKLIDGVTGKDALGFLLSTGTVARVTNPAFLAENIAPAITNIAATGGDTPKQGAALVAAISTAISDSTGAISGTAGINLDAALEKAFPDLPDIEARINFLRSDQAAREKFVSETSFRAKTAKPIEQILTPGTKFAKIFDDFLTQIVPVKEGEAAFENKSAQFKGTAFRSNLDLQDTFKSIEARLKVSDTEGARVSIAREGLQDILTAVGVGPTSRKIARASFERRVTFGAQDALGSVVNDLERRSDRFQKSVAVVGRRCCPDKQTHSGRAPTG